MNTPREPDDRDDELLAAYQRASAQEGRTPAPEMRERILAQVRRDHAPAAANDSRWRVRAAAGVAVLGLVGWLTVHDWRNRPRPSAPMLNTDSMAAASVAKPAPAAAPGTAAAPSAAREPLEQHSGSARAQYSARAAAPATAPAAAEVRTESRVANAASSAGPARMSAAQADSLQRTAAPRALASRALAPGDETQVRRAVSAQFAGLFLPRDGDHLNRVIVLMDRSGNIVRSAVESAPASTDLGEQPGAAEDFQSLGLRTDDMVAPGFIVLVENAAMAGAPDRVLLVRYAWTREPAQ